MRIVIAGMTLETTRPADHVHDPVGAVEQALIVGDDQDGRPLGPVGEVAEQSHHDRARGGVERGRRLVGEHEQGAVDQRRAIATR